MATGPDQLCLAAAATGGKAVWLSRADPASRGPPTQAVTPWPEPGSAHALVVGRPTEEQHRASQTSSSRLFQLPAGFVVRRPIQRRLAFKMEGPGLPARRSQTTAWGAGAAECDESPSCGEEWMSRLKYNLCLVRSRGWQTASDLHVSSFYSLDINSLIDE